MALQHEPLLAEVEESAARRAANDLLEVASADGCGEIEDRPRHRRHADRVADDELVLGEIVRAVRQDPPAPPRPRAIRERHVHRERRRVAEVPQRAGARVAQRAPRAVGGDCRRPPALLPQLRVAEGVHAAVKHHELPGAHALVDDGLRHARRDQHSPRHDAVGARRRCRDDTVVGALTGHIPV
jgi:hypothetical protein